MFHVNAWGIPYSAAAVGCKLVFPGAQLDGKSVYELLVAERVTFAAGVPTVWQMLLTYMGANGLKLPHLQRTVIGGSACPPAMIQAFRKQYGVEVLHAWGMTELSPLGTLCTLKNKHLSLPEEEQMKIRLKQGRAIFGIDMKIVDADGRELPCDGKTQGDLLVRVRCPRFFWTRIRGRKKKELGMLSESKMGRVALGSAAEVERWSAGRKM